MLEEFVSPLSDAVHGLTHEIEHTRNGGIQAAARQFPVSGHTAQVVLKQPDPDARQDTFPADPVGQFLHVPELCIGDPGTAVIDGFVTSVFLIPPDLPSVINHHERAVFRAFREARHIFCIREDFLCGASAVGVIPVVGTVYRFFGKNGIGAHHSAEGLRGFKGRHACIDPADHARRFQGSASELNTAAAVSHIHFEGDALRIHLPGADRAGPDHDAVTGGEFAKGDQEVPRQCLVGRQSFPSQIRIGAFPCIPEHLTAHSFFEVPSQADLTDRCRLCGERNLQAVLLFPGFNYNIFK